jgi:hypothetical protein
MEGEKIRNARGGEMKIWIRKQQKPSEKEPEKEPYTLQFEYDPNVRL